MTDPAYPPGAYPDGGAPSEMRTLVPGGGGRLRQSYTKLLVASLIAVATIMTVAVVATATVQSGSPVLTLLAWAVLLVSAGCAVMALVRGRASVHGDRVSLPALRASRSLARAGSTVGWVGALAIVVTGLLRHLQGADDALIGGIVLGAGALIPAVCNDGALRIAKRLITA